MAHKKNKNIHKKEDFQEMFLRNFLSEKMDRIKEQIIEFRWLYGVYIEIPSEEEFNDEIHEIIHFVTKTDCSENEELPKGDLKSNTNMYL